MRRVKLKIYREDSLERNLIAGKSVAVLGYGNQGHAHALNLRDSGVDVIVGSRPGGRGSERAAEDGFQPVPVGEAASRAEYVVMLLPDEVQGEVFVNEIRDNLQPGAALVFAHGFAIAFGEVQPPDGHDVVLVAPKGQGNYLRKLYKEGEGLPCLVAMKANSSEQALEKALSYAALIGCLRAGAIATSFREEAVTDLFGEQVILCGGVPELVKAGFDILVERGYNPAVAYLECLHELKIITDLMHEGGIKYMRELISRTAAWGSFTAGSRVVSPEVRERMREILETIELGNFAREWMEEARGGQKKLSELIDAESFHEIERAGENIRALMPYLKKKKG